MKCLMPWLMALAASLSLGCGGGATDVADERAMANVLECSPGLPSCEDVRQMGCSEPGITPCCHEWSYDSFCVCERLQGSPSCGGMPLRPESPSAH